MLILMAESRATVRRDRLERSAKVLGHDEPFASLGPESRAALIHEQSIIVEFEPRPRGRRRCRTCLPDKEERQQGDRGRRVHRRRGGGNGAEDDSDGAALPCGPRPAGPRAAGADQGPAAGGCELQGRCVASSRSKRARRPPRQRGLLRSRGSASPRQRHYRRADSRVSTLDGSGARASSVLGIIGRASELLRLVGLDPAERANIRTNFRRAASADRDRARLPRTPTSSSATSRPQRSTSRSRRDPQPSARHAGEARARVPPDHPQSRRSPLHGSAHRRHVSRTLRRDRQDR